MTEWVQPERFAYRVEGFTNILGRLVTHANGLWVLTRDADGSAFTWTYAFHPRSRLTVPLVRVFIRTLWSGYMAQCADLCVGSAERAPG